MQSIHHTVALMNYRNTELYEKYGKVILSNSQYNILIETVVIVYFLTGAIRREIEVDL